MKQLTPLRILMVLLITLFSQMATSQNELVFSWDKTGCQQDSISKMSFDDDFHNGSCLKVCPETTFIYRITGPGVENISKIKWMVSGGKAEVTDELSIPILWDNSYGGSIKITATFKDGTLLEQTRCVQKSVSSLLLSWDKIGCQINNDNVSEIKLDQNFTASNCLKVCQDSKVEYKISGDGSLDIETIEWAVTAGKVSSIGEQSALIAWDNELSGSIAMTVVFKNGARLQKSICVRKIPSSLLLNWEKIEEGAVCEIKYDKNSEENAEVLLVHPESTLYYKIEGEKVSEIESVDWTVTGGYAYSPNSLATLITWDEALEKGFLEMKVNYHNGEVVERKMLVAKAQAAPDPGEQDQTSIAFDYDLSGNQTKRKMIVLAKQSNMTTSASERGDELAETERKLTQSEEYSDISYHPNPVRSELYLEWKSKEGESVQSMQVFNASGQIMQSLKDLQSIQNTTLNFESYPTGIYHVVLNFSTGQNKTLKIVKQ